MKPNLLNNKGFTLIELVIVLSIFAILASAALSAFVDISNKAMGVQEDATIKSLQSGAFLYYSKNSSWYGLNSTDDIFLKFLENPPPHIVDVDGSGTRILNVQWYLLLEAAIPFGIWQIRCPHYDGSRGKLYRFYPYSAQYDIIVNIRH